MASQLYFLKGTSKNKQKIDSQIIISSCFISTFQISKKHDRLKLKVGISQLMPLLAKKLKILNLVLQEKINR